MHKLRKALAEGKVPKFDSPLAERGEHANNSDGKLNGVIIQRETARQTDQRNEDRFPASYEKAQVVWKDKETPVNVINFSSNGVQIETELKASIADSLLVSFEGCEAIECSVRWVREDRIGLEFAAETQILADAGVVQYVVEGIKGVLTAAGAQSDNIVGIENRSQHQRHGLIWIGTLSLDENSFMARVRNISQGGAMLHVESTQHLKKGRAVTLNLGEAGEIDGTIVWSTGLEVGVDFVEEFDLAGLALQTAVETEAVELGDPPPEPVDDGPWFGYSTGHYESPYEGIEESGRLTLEEVYATLYPNGRPDDAGERVDELDSKAAPDSSGKLYLDQPSGAIRKKKPVLLRD